MNRTQKAITNHYVKGLHDFTHERLAPPPSVVAGGGLLAVEVVSQLMTLHEDCLGRVRKHVPGFDARLAKAGPQEVVGPLLGELAGFYDIAIDQLEEAFALRDDPDAVYDRSAQPRRADGALDLSVLGPEADAEFDRGGWSERVAEVEAYATPYDPRLPLVRSMVALSPEGIAWVSCPRPQNLQVARFDALRLIHQQSNQWCLEFTDWRRRRLAERLDPGGWQHFLRELRALSAEAGFVWETPTEGRPHPGGDEVAYELADWTPEARRTLTRALEEAAIPHRWDGGTLLIPADHEEAVDRTIGAA